MKQQIDSFRLLAKDAGYTYIVWKYDRNELFLKSAVCDMKCHWNTNDEAWSVRTTLKHPRLGESELWRNFLTEDDVKRVIMNPREHIGKGHVSHIER
jgi:hypothetical protein